VKANGEYTEFVNAAAAGDRFLVGRDGRLHDSEALTLECSIDEKTSLMPLQSLDEVEGLARLMKVKACMYCSTAAEVTDFWRRWATRQAE
jgi:hypothetical protein